MTSWDSALASPGCSTGSSQAEGGGGGTVSLGTTTVLRVSTHLPYLTLTASPGGAEAALVVMRRLMPKVSSQQLPASSVGSPSFGAVGWEGRRQLLGQSSPWLQLLDCLTPAALGLSAEGESQ